MCYWFLCVPFTRTFATTEESSADAEESTCLRRGFLVSLDVVGYLILLATVVCLQGCLLLVLFLSGGHFRHKFGWFVNAFLSATIIVIIPTAISFILWSKRKNVSTPAEEIVEMETMWTIDLDPTQTPAEQIVEMGTTSTIDLNPVQLGELNVEISDSKEGIQGSEAGFSFVCECCAKRLLPFYIIVILLSEIALIFLNPFDSIFPIGIASDEIVVPLEGEFIRSKHCPSCPDHCTDIEQKVREARAFYKHSLVDFSVVRIGYGGIPKHFNNDGAAAAQAIDRSVYLPLDGCPETSLMIHEFAHVWQMQSGWWFQNGVSKLIRYKKEEKKDRFALYDYGGLEGLRNAAEDPHATMTSAFWVEQQAEIVEDYYDCLHSFSCSSEEQQLLMRFSNDILYDDSKLGKKSCEVEDLILTWVASEDCPPKVLSLSEDLIEYRYDAETANEIEASTDGVLGDRLQFPGCSSVYLNVKLKEGISSGFCECDNNDDLCNLSFNDAENQESSNCGIYDIYQWSCPNEANH